MIHIILLILKIIGFIILGILALLLAILLIALFMPFKYEFSGGFHEKPDITVKLRWLFGGLKVQAAFKDNTFGARASLLWFKIFDTQKNEVEPEVEADAANEAVVISDADILEEAADIPVRKEPTGSEPKPQKEVSQLTAPPKPEKVSAEILPNEKIKQEKKKKEKTPKGPGLFQRLSDKIQGFVDGVGGKVESIENKWNSLLRIWNATCTQNSIAFVKKALLSILHHIRPRKLRGQIHFGMEKPSDTGKILGYSSMLYSWYGDNIQLIPDFEQSVFEGDLYFRGHVQLYIFVFWALRGLLNKDIRKLIKYIKHIKNKEETLWQ
ncbi:MAG: DUF2953 domain-containing protein [Clostridia bacterium]|nr:DUF2953 domain-containing protein [Clostridia bacterium]